MTNILILVGLVAALIVTYFAERKVESKDAELDKVRDDAAMNGNECDIVMQRAGWTMYENCFIHDNGAIQYCTIRRIFRITDIFGKVHWKFVVEYFSCMGLQRTILQFDEDEFLNVAFRDYGDARKGKSYAKK